MTNKIPKHWGHSKLVTVWKRASKGSSQDPNAYRGLQIGSSLCKILVMLIINRLKTWYEKQLLDQQNGFRKGRGTIDGIFAAKQIHQISNNMKKPVYALFVDLTAAFDHIKRSWMFKTIRQRLGEEADSKLIELLESLYSYTTTSLAETPDDIFEVILGVRQGGSESPMMYNLYMDYVVRIFLEKCELDKIKFLNLKYEIPSTATTGKRTKIGWHTFDWVGYPDDISLAFENISDMQRALNLLSTTFNRFHLNLNVSKTKSMILNYQYIGLNYPHSISSLNGEKIENVKTFKYLGSQIKYDEANTGDAELELRIDTAESKFYELGKQFLNYRIMLNTRVKVFNALVRSRLTYACQTWNLTKKQMRHLNASYMSMIRKMVRGGYRRKVNSYSYEITNQDLIQKCKLEPLENYVARQQRSYVARIIRNDDSSISKRLLFNNNKSKKQGRKVNLYNTVVNKEEITADSFNHKALNSLY